MFKSVYNLASYKVYHTATLPRTTPEMPKVLGPHFFPRVFREKGEESEGVLLDAASREEYLVELIASELGMKDNLDAVKNLGR